MTALITDPTCFPLRLDVNQGAISFIKLSREEIAETTFLDHRAPGAGVTIATAPIAELKAQWDAARKAGDVRQAARAYIFHTAFCSSTLISRCLDAPGGTLALKEPALLVDISSARRFGAAPVKSEIRDIERVATALLARPFEGEDHVVIKPSNGASDLLPDLLEDDAQAQALLLFTGMRAFLISVIKRGERGRRFVRTLLHHPWGGDARLDGLTGAQALQMTDLQAAALAWRFQAEAFAKALAQFPADRVRALDADDFHRDPAGALDAVDRFFGLGLGTEHIDKTVSGPLMMADSKRQHQAFSAETRRETKRAIEDRYGKDLDTVIKWAEQLPFERSAPLSSTLLRD